MTDCNNYWNGIVRQIIEVLGFTSINISPFIFFLKKRFTKFNLHGKHLTGYQTRWRNNFDLTIYSKIVFLVISFKEPTENFIDDS